MKKRILAILMVLAMLFCLAACSSSSSNSSDSSSDDSSTDTTAENSGDEESKDEGAESDDAGEADTAEGEYTHKPESQVTIQLAAGGTSGSWYSIFASIAEIVNKEDCNIVLKVVPGGGIANPATIGTGEAEMGLLYGSFGLAARAGEDPYTEAYDNLYAVTGGFMPMSLEISVLKDKGVTSFEDAITGSDAADILTGINSTSTGWYFQRILEYYGTSVDDIASRGGSVTNSEYGDWVQMATDGHVDLMFNHIGIPSSTLLEIATSRECDLLDMPDDLIDYFVNEHAMIETTIEAGAYDFLDHDVKTVMSPTVLAVSADVSDDVVYTLLEVINAHQDEIRALHASLTDFDLSTAWESAGIPLHPGAEQFFEDKGWK